MGSVHISPLLRSLVLAFAASTIALGVQRPQPASVTDGIVGVLGTGAKVLGGLSAMPDGTLWVFCCMMATGGAGSRIPGASPFSWRASHLSSDGSRIGSEIVLTDDPRLAQTTRVTPIGTTARGDLIAYCSYDIGLGYSALGRIIQLSKGGLKAVGPTLEHDVAAGRSVVDVDGRVRVFWIGQDSVWSALYNNAGKRFALMRWDKFATADQPAFFYAGVGCVLVLDSPGRILLAGIGNPRDSALSLHRLDFTTLSVLASGRLNAFSDLRTSTKTTDRTTGQWQLVRGEPGYWLFTPGLGLVDGWWRSDFSRSAAYCFSSSLAPISAGRSLAAEPAGFTLAPSGSRVAAEYAIDWLPNEYRANNTTRRDGTLRITYIAFGADGVLYEQRESRGVSSVRSSKPD